MEWSFVWLLVVALSVGLVAGWLFMAMRAGRRRGHLGVLQGGKAAARRAGSKTRGR